MMMEKAAWKPRDEHEDETMAPVPFPHPLGCFKEKDKEEQCINGRCIQ